ncbi:DUF2474 family protein [Aristophania vespae]|uniref:DUF2474 family protein n=1 Tax=Aristophania vespae TaxID=2697033 RepID=A0A6P1NAU2_9PROT|nr:DUF2474 domain-containing protein [Aristophania vespae]QHI95516.1 DUF2474 family protein [Aristophania vespae]
MAIIKIVQQEDEKTPQSLWKRLGWFVLIWGSGTATIMIIASLLHFIIPK